jgi:hypothetical protein
VAFSCASMTVFKPLSVVVIGPGKVHLLPLECSSSSLKRGALQVVRGAGAPEEGGVLALSLSGCRRGVRHITAVKQVQ